MTDITEKLLERFSNMLRRAWPASGYTPEAATAFKMLVEAAQNVGVSGTDFKLARDVADANAPPPQEPPAPPPDNLSEEAIQAMMASYLDQTQREIAEKWASFYVEIERERKIHEAGLAAKEGEYQGRLNKARETLAKPRRETLEDMIEAAIKRNKS